MSDRAACAALAAVFGIWLLVTVLAHLKPFGALRRWDHLALIPTWNFFAPRPSTDDYVLLYRMKLADGSRSCWTELRQDWKRDWWSALWNPGKRARKALLDLCMELRALLPELDSEALTVSLPYLVLFFHAAHAATGATGVQFAVMMSERGMGGELSFKFIYASRSHELDFAQ